MLFLMLLIHNYLMDALLGQLVPVMVVVLG